MPVVDPYAVFASARAVWQSARYPAFMTYQVRISADANGHPVVNTYMSSVDTQRGAIAVRATSAEEAAKPPNPHGVALNATVSVGYATKSALTAPPTVNGPAATLRIGKTMRLSQPDQYDILGVPLLSPTYSFGLATPQATAAALPPPATTLPTIASVTAQSRRYDVNFDGEENVDGHPCYRLKLTPRVKPNVYRLRELWIDERDYSTHQAATDGNFTTGPGPTLRWLIHFTTIDGRPYISDESAIGTMRYLGHVYSNIHVAFDNVAPRDRFDKAWTISLFSTRGDVLREP